MAAVRVIRRVLDSTEFAERWMKAAKRGQTLADFCRANSLQPGNASLRRWEINKGLPKKYQLPRLRAGGAWNGRQIGLHSGPGRRDYAKIVEIVKKFS